MEVQYTEGIPICPNCKKPTKREVGESSTTALHYAPIYNEEGQNINPNRNITTRRYWCFGCASTYVVEGNKIDGFNYK